MATVDFEKTQLARALRVTPRASQTASKAPGEVGPRLDPGAATDFPLFAAAGAGAYVFDERGRKYLDCFGANAAIPLGYARAEVVEAVSVAIAYYGSLLSLPHVMEARVSEQFLRVCAPWAAQVRWLKTGSEACHAAYKTAKKLAKGHDPRVFIGDWAYHGWHEWCSTESLDVFRFGWGEDLATSPHAQVNDIAAVFVEPNRWLTAPVGWLEGLRAFCDKVGALLVFDEMVYGLRWRKGGGAEYYGVRPDLACFGKALGNGVAVACVCGAADVMAACGRTVSGTYGGETLGLAAAEAVLGIYESEDVIGRLWMNGGETWAAFAEACAPEAARLEGTPVHWRLAGLSDWALDRALEYCAAEDVLMHRASNNASAAMTAEDARRAGRTIGAAASAAAAAERAR